MIDLEYEWFKKKIKTISGIDLDSYRPDQMKRLMSKALDKSGARNYVEFIKQLENSPANIQAFRDSVTINVSSLFRDAQRWNELNKHLPELVRDVVAGKGGGDSKTFRIWSAGCSIGAEPYTLAILMEELAALQDTPHFSYQILCTDIDNTMLQRARDGIFTDADTKEVTHRLLSKYFNVISRPDIDWASKSTASVFYDTVPSIKRNMKFIMHNILDERWEKGFNLIVCRNVLIYFNNDIKERLFRKFHEALLGGGILFIGGTEVMFNANEIGFKNLSAGIYKKKIQEGNA
ncbi:MAG: protein-glutamate O-methyltransferase CheR [bacterium]